LTISDQEAHAIYRYALSGTTATLEGTVLLSGSSDCVQTWIAKTLVFCPAAGNVDVLTGSFSEPIGAVQVAK
jgi:hypothetical protein